MTNLFVSYYKAATPERQEEIDCCLKKNSENPLIDAVYVFNYKGVDMDRICEICKSSKQQMGFNIGYERPTYKDFISAVNHYFNGEGINIISNADIIFDETLSRLEMLKENDCWALSRWEMNERFEKHPQQIQIHGDSQDSWIFRGKIKQLAKADFPLGKMGCDNRIAYEIKKAGYNISNPSLTVKTWHVHNTNVRGYNPSVRNENTVVSEPYLSVPVTAL